MESRVNSRVHSCGLIVTPVPFTYKVTSRIVVLSLFGSHLQTAFSLASVVMTMAGSSRTSSVLLSQHFNNKEIVFPLPTSSQLIMSPTTENTSLAGSKRCSSCASERPLDWFETKAPGSHGLLNTTTKTCKQCRVRCTYISIRTIGYSHELRTSKPHSESANVKSKLQQSPANLIPYLSISLQPRDRRQICWGSQARANPHLQPSHKTSNSGRCSIRSRPSSCLIKTRSMLLPNYCWIGLKSPGMLTTARKSSVIVKEEAEHPRVERTTDSEPRDPAAWSALSF